MVKSMRPTQSVLCLHPEKLRAAARSFITHFPGRSLYAVKSNPDPYVLTKLWNAGIHHFDVASMGEIELINGLFPEAHMAFMNPVKSREAIATAYRKYGICDFVVDTQTEIDKIVAATHHAPDLRIVVRIAMPKGSAACQLTGKFGCTPDQGVDLLRSAAKVASAVGLSFHVGSQTLDPQSYADAIRQGGDILRRAGVAPAIFDVGGGFPISGLGMEVPPLQTFFDVIRAEIAALNLPESCEIWSEPGRALSGESATLVVRVELRKGDLLYINDGSYGNMFEVSSMGWRNNATLHRLSTRGNAEVSKETAPFRFYGQTCDSVDYMAGPFILPQDVCEGDWIALDGMGAYMAASQTRFNGFYSDNKVEIITSPLKRRTHLQVVK